MDREMFTEWLEASPLWVFRDNCGDEKMIIEVSRRFKRKRSVRTVKEIRPDDLLIQGERFF